MERKNCSLCKQLRTKEEFGNSSRSKDGKRSQCKQCESEYRKKVRDSNEEFTLKKCSTCKIDKASSEFSKNISQKDGYCNRCKICVKSHYNKNSEVILERNSTYRSLNLDKVRLNKQLKYNNVLKHDPLYILNVRFLAAIRSGIKSVNLEKKSRKSEEILGCTIQEFKKNIEKQFLNWMNWENHGNKCEKLEYSCSWDLDHIIPISYAKTEEESYILNHWSNFQPLCSKINRGSKNSNIYPLTNLELKITINN